MTAGGDEISRAAATAFSDFGLQYQGLIRELGTINERLTAALTASSAAFAQAEARIAASLGINSGSPLSPVYHSALHSTTPTAVDAILIMNGSGAPIPSSKYINAVLPRFLSGFTSAVVSGVPTPEGLYPLTGVKDLTLNISLARGVTILDNAIRGVLGPDPSTKSVSVFGYSQSAVLSSLEMPKLLAEGYNPTNATFTLIGNPANPNGGLFARFPGLSMPSLGITFGTSTPSNDFPTTIWPLEYDGFADFPRYPINVLSDLNALAGIVYGHLTYPSLPESQLNSAIALHQSGAPSLTNYYMIPTQNLPLLQPLRAIPFIGNPLADLIQPDLRYLINWGYGDINYGWSTTPADVPTPFGFLPPWETTGALLGPTLVHGAQQGINAFAADIATQLPTALPALPSLPTVPNLFAGGTHTGFTTPPALPSINGVIAGIQTANTNLSTSLVGDLSTAYATLLPTTDIAVSLAVTAPSYNLNLFLDGIRQAINGDPVGGLINAIGRPIAADVGLLTFGTGIGLLAAGNSVQTILLGTPFPKP